MSKEQTSDKVRVGISCGDLNGVGLEVVIRCFMDQRMMEHVTPIVYCSGKTASAYRKLLGIEDFSFHRVKNADEALPKKANLINVWEDEIQLDLGKPSVETGKYAYYSLEAATEDLANGKIDVLVTAPIDKKTIQGAGFDFPGHTEFLASLSNVDEALMFLVSEDLRVGVVTGHIPLKDVPTAITQERILKKLDMMEMSLTKDFGITRPKLAVLGLNPHAGDQGLLGEEDGTIIAPAIRKAQERGLLAFGPYAADGFFGSNNWKNFDGVLAMYHDQGLAPFKALSFGTGVNFTAGLPIVRTSPDHGTAYDIAGKGEANEASIRAAIFLARDIFMHRKLHKEITENPLQSQKAKPMPR